MSGQILLITPPFTQLNTPYPATAYLKGFLNTQGISAGQMDLGLELFLNLFSKKGLQQIITHALNNIPKAENSFFIQNKEKYLSSIDTVISYLQEVDLELEEQLQNQNFLPQGKRFDSLVELDWLWNDLDEIDQIKYRCTLFLEDIGDFITEFIDPDFGFSRYAEQIARSARSFDAIYNRLQEKESLIEEMQLEVLKEKLIKTNPSIVLFTIPFPGNVFSAFRSAQYLKKKFPEIKLLLGGGFVNTELRSLSDSRVFEFFDFISLDDGERPLLSIINYLQGKLNRNQLKRTFILEDNQVKYVNDLSQKDFAQRELGTPDYSDLHLDKYVSFLEMINPMHRLWSDGKWNKLTMAHGCYWGKCTFCDISLDYIGRYEPLTATLICDRMEELIQQTGNNGFHFVDEAAPPSLMKELAIEIRKRNLEVEWWTNIRFEKAFTFDLCQLLASSGCIAVTGGLEVASDRLLQLIDKGVSIEQVSKVTHHFTANGIMVHAYLMYGYPTQTEQETIDALEIVRQLFENGIVQSAFWHRFALTEHSPIALQPDKYEISITSREKGSFANNDLEYEEWNRVEHEKFGAGLRKSLYNFMYDTGFDIPLKDWFEFSIPDTTHSPNIIQEYIQSSNRVIPRENHKIVFGTFEDYELLTKNSAELIWGNGTTVLRGKNFPIQSLIDLLQLFSKANKGYLTYQEFEKGVREYLKCSIEEFFITKDFNSLREEGLLFV